MSAILGYHSVLAAVFKFKLPEISTSPVLHDLVRSFKVEVPVRPVRPPPWDLEVVLCFLRSSTFKPLSSLSLHALTKKVLFLVLLAMTKQVGELQTVSCGFVFFLSCLFNLCSGICCEDRVGIKSPSSLVLCSVSR